MFFAWLFADELTKLAKGVAEAKEMKDRYAHDLAQLKNILGNTDVAVDVSLNRYSRSWAAISIQGQKCDLIRFYEMGESDIRYIEGFLRSFERAANIKVDAPPHLRGWLKTKNKF